MLDAGGQNPRSLHMPTFQTWKPGGEVHVVLYLGRRLAVWAHGSSVCRTLVEEMVTVASGTAGGDDGGASGRPLTKAQLGHRSYNLQERRRIGSMTGVEQALLPRVPTDESEAQTLATADLDLMKSECCWCLCSLIVGET